MSFAPLQHVTAQFSPVVHAPSARVSRQLSLLGAPPTTSVVFHTAAADALSGPTAAQRNNAPAVSLYAPGAYLDVRA